MGSENNEIPLQASGKSKFIRHFPKIAGAVCILSGCVVLAGWLAHLPSVVKTFPNLPSVKFNSALSFVFCGVAVLMLGGRHAGKARWFAVVPFAVGLLTLLEYSSGHDLAIDQFFLKDETLSVNTASPGRMAPLTAACFLTIGVGLFAAGGRKKWHVAVSGLTACVVGTAGGVALLGHILGIGAATGWGGTAHMGLLTSALFPLLGLGLLNLKWRAAVEQKFLFRRWAPITCSVTLMVMVGLVSMMNMVHWRTDTFWREHTFQVILAADAVQNTLLDVQRGARGYVILGDTNALAAFRNAAPLEKEKLRDLAQLTTDNPSQQRQLRELTGAIDDVFNYDRRVIDLFENRGTDAVLRMDKTGEGRAVFGKARDLLTAFSEEEKRLLSLRDSVEQADFRNTTRLLVFGIVLAAVLLLIYESMIVREFAQRNLAEKKLAEQALELESSNQELGQFAYVASHDMREPLRAISGFAQILGKYCQEKLDDRAREMVRQIIEGANRMSDLIDDLLALSRVGSQGKPFEAVAIEKVLELTKQQLSVVIHERGAIIRHESLPTLPADGSQLLLVFQNLLANAIKFCKGRAPEIRVGAVKQTDGFWKLSVADNGIGIDPKHFDRIFGIFQRLHTRDEYPGTGIGLAICKKIVERHGGRIWLESAPGNGTVFHFTLPDRQRTQLVETQPAPALPDFNRPRKEPQPAPGSFRRPQVSPLN
jgi:signal transduction histidine kinase